jgi:hypothetical protein
LGYSVTVEGKPLSEQELGQSVRLLSFSFLFPFVFPIHPYARSSSLSTSAPCSPPLAVFHPSSYHRLTLPSPAGAHLVGVRNLLPDPHWSRRRRREADVLSLRSPTARRRRFPPRAQEPGRREGRHRLGSTTEGTAMGAGGEELQGAQGRVDGAVRRRAIIYSFAFSSTSAHAETGSAVLVRPAKSSPSLPYGVLTLQRNIPLFAARRPCPPLTGLCFIRRPEFWLDQAKMNSRSTRRSQPCLARGTGRRLPFCCRAA